MSQNTRRERREKDRRKSAAPKRTSFSPRGRRPGWLMPGVVIVAVIALIFGLRAAGVFEPNPAAAINVGDAKYNPPSVIGVKQKDEGATHVPDAQRVTYGTTPPTTGSHWGTPAAWGSYDTQQPNERTTHNLEHGGIVISYNGLSSDETVLLKAIVARLRTDVYRKIVLQPYPTLSDAKVAVSSWGWQLKLQSVDDVQIIQFVRSHYDSPDAPEPGVG